ncbi:6-bladed beta-propeller [Parabacteroides pacaensis]|uniref:6-bladed beta-propeller n=1 Tax=Parabacteroides pacaensis TaxID=2086575 RepID=UPI000D102A48|nr:6-bladed beta-propeller [Parabacteroides pacaensis]
MEDRTRILLVLIIGFICCCTARHKDKSQVQEDSNNILTIHLDEKNNQVSFYDLFQNVSLIQLETKEESLLNSIDKIIFHNDSIFIMDTKQGTIFLFNSHGKYLNKLSHQGAGPKEYFDLTDFTLNRYTNKLELLSTYQGIYCFDLDFKFVEMFPFSNKGMPVHRFAVVDSCTRVFFNFIRPHKIETYDICKKQISGKYFELPTHVYRSTSLGGPFLLENKQNGEAIFTQAFSNTIYSITQSSFKPKYKWDFGRYNFSIDELEPNLTQNEYDNIIRNDSFRNSHVFTFTANTENSRLYLTQFGFGVGKGLFTVLWDKATGKYVKFKKLEEGIPFPYYPILTENSIYTIVRDTFTINAYLNDRIKKENTISIEKFNEEQNPMLLKYKLKDISF